MVKECNKMPVVELNLNRLKKLIGGRADKKKIIKSLPYLGLDIESESKNEIRIEYSPNRPDYCTDFGIALGLQGLLGVKKGMPKLDIKKNENYQINVNSSVSAIRPFVTAIVATNGIIDEHLLKELLVMQEDLHFGLGRRRKKSSIGIHDLDKISFPLRYSVTSRDYQFVPLHSNEKNSINQILKNSEVGQEYGHLLGNSSKIPIIMDAQDDTISIPPIINAAKTSVTTKTKNLFVEVTGLDKNDVEDVLSVVAMTLQSAGFQLNRVKISGAKNSTPLFQSRKMQLDSALVENTLGIHLSSNQISTSLKKSRIDTSLRGKKIDCTIPRYRFDIFGPMDLIEEVALGYGIENLEPTLSPSQTIGNKNEQTRNLDSINSIMTGLGYIEVLNSSLTSKRVLYDMTNRNSEKLITVLDSKSLEHTLLRDSLIPGMLETLSRNIHEQYPQKIFETGTVFEKSTSLREEIHLCVLSSHKDANFSEIKSVLQSLLATKFGNTSKTKSTLHPTFENGRVANIIFEDKKIGIIGEISENTKKNFKIREPVTAFEIKLPG